MKQAFVLAAVLAFAAAPARAQISLQPTDPPTATAETEAWYQSAEPIAFGGGVYFPAGPITHFLRNEMVAAGDFDGVPIYIRTTVERGSLIYVPLAGGLVRPYERRRTGDLAGTSGSQAPSFPVVLATDTARQAAEPATVRTPADILAEPVGIGSLGTATAAPEPVGTGGIVRVAPTAPPAPMRLETARRPVGLNDVFVDFDNTRWFAAGRALELAGDRFERIGDYRGYPVYRRSGRADTIYVALTTGAAELLTPYTRK